MQVEMHIDVAKGSEFYEGMSDTNLLQYVSIMFC